MDLVSICIPVFNGARYLEAALRSAERQTHPHVEILVSDNGSTDGSVELIRAFAARSTRPVTLFTTAPPGMVQNWNFLGEQARGRWIKYLFHDDELDAQCVETMLSSVGSAQSVTMVFSKRRIRCEATTDAVTRARVASLELMHDRGFPRRCPGSWYLSRRDLLWHETVNFVGEPTNVMIDRRTFLALNGFSTRSTQIVDFQMWLRCMALGDVVFVDEPLATFRVHEEQMTARNIQSGAAADSQEMRVLLQTLSIPHIFRSLHPAVRAEIRRALVGWPDESYVPSPSVGERLRAAVDRLRGRRP